MGCLVLLGVFPFLCTFGSTFSKGQKLLPSVGMELRRHIAPYNHWSLKWVKNKNSLPPVQCAIQLPHGITATRLGLQDPCGARGRFALQSGHCVMPCLPKAPCRLLTEWRFPSGGLDAQPHLVTAGFTVCRRFCEVLWIRKEKENPCLLTCFNLTPSEEILLARETLFSELNIWTH